jgi:hypothetical protein
MSDDDTGHPNIQPFKPQPKPAAPEMGLPTLLPPQGVGVSQQTPRELLESSAIHWRRDFDALLVGFVVGVLATIAVWGMW